MNKSGKKHITIADVAEALGVSKTTVSRAISGKGRIGKETRERVLLYIEEHDYKPNVIAKGLAQSKTYNLGVAMPGDAKVAEWNFFQACLLGIQEAAQKAGYDILLTLCSPLDISSLERVIANRKVDGVILMRTFVKDAQIEFLQRKKLPFVTIGSTDYAGVVQIDHDHKSACRELTLRLLKKGMHRIALLGEDEGDVVTRNRLCGFREAYEKLQIPFDESLLYIGRTQSGNMERRTGDILKQKADCILCMDDAAASHVLRVLREKKIKVPQEMCVASFYDSTILENYVPSVTSLVFDEKELGRAACRTLLAMVEGAAAEPYTLLPYEIVMKESTLCNLQ